MSKISIVVPVYGVEQYLEECVDSLINQTFKDIEIILVSWSTMEVQITAAVSAMHLLHVIHKSGSFIKKTVDFQLREILVLIHHLVNIYAS